MKKPMFAKVRDIYQFLGFSGKNRGKFDKNG